ncbi:NADPH-dependent 7-cyano-7-deazaguanine reductase QueF [Oceanicoccus sagamiensis]|uniref:NADPH-dependent 7-cyano-7-deazaguanine reductase n=1 Tax=Oceanicoccus sagamiensis TaxID=716816 RepID=A0A1X9NCX2_9GAMM|nr:NADPH-dependent 7-cyano-7-deazaguanine reductase QueF [Oceanicoccus sagamiensis]ARN75888.1 NADPH-dependent 7-cyano-7-deazaguanine reductase QueF [Oceanicoccus sagamiensis]
MKDILLGKDVEYVDTYSPDLLFPIARQQSRDSLGVAAGQLPFTGVDIWNAYELSWLNAKGKPQVACAEFRFPCESSAIVESKSFKLYLNSFNQTVVRDRAELQARLVQDLSACVQAPVDVIIHNVANGNAISQLEGVCLDDLDISLSSYSPDPLLLGNVGQQVEETLYSHLLRSLCPVTAQPDWASIVVQYTGPQINHEGLLKYLIGYRQHQEFHEQCVERIFTDISAACDPQRLSVRALYTRRGGLDINPFRASYPHDPQNIRLNRQ